eukprot:7377795-Prymnesium_polylepis.1
MAQPMSSAAAASRTAVASATRLFFVAAPLAHGLLRLLERLIGASGWRRDSLQICRPHIEGRLSALHTPALLGGIPRKDEASLAVQVGAAQTVELNQAADLKAVHHGARAASKNWGLGLKTSTRSHPYGLVCYIGMM